MISQDQFKNLVFHDIFSYPLTAWELKKFAWHDDFTSLENPDNYQPVSGFYCLSNRQSIIKTRHDNFVISVAKLRRVRRLIKWLRLLPSVKMIAICNSLGFLNATAGSDIDLFIVTAPNKIWLTRFWLQGILKLLHLRPYDRGHKKDSFCLTFFLSQADLDIRSLQINKPDIYLVYWLTKLLPMYDPENIYQKLWSANSWIKQYLPQVEPLELDNFWVVKKSLSTQLFSWLNWQIWEQPLKKIQLKLMPTQLKQMANRDSRVVINDKILKFHGADDKREYYQTLWKEKCLSKN